MGYKSTLRVSKLLNPLLVTLPSGICWYLFYADLVAQPYYNKRSWMVIALFFVLYVTYRRTCDGFRITLVGHFIRKCRLDEMPRCIANIILRPMISFR